MEKSVIKKLRIVLWAFIIISIPAGYYIYSASLLDKAYKAWEVASISDKDEDIEFALNKIEEAEPFAIFDKNLVNIKVQLLYRKKEYRKVLEAIEEKNLLIYKGLLYEHLDRSDSAAICYEKAIPMLKNQQKKIKKDVHFANEIGRQIALCYTFLSQTDSANKYLTKIPEDYDPELKEWLLQYDYYIENYVSGGYKDYLEGETLLFGTDSISNMNIDSLFTANRFYFDNHSSRGNKHEYEIKKIFEQKAISIGMNRIE
ncbi:hypothetical protein KEM09_21485 [Carboxylicivirga mesophila]|uniref:Tetratricopeptide repeat protein n=1 Tax=Carboxylicivirga mesophila TaxID=1166478 RepID=A0ABS5KG47_9BACT|nr:hypothetical protein [Carboxylicivirga mesophila]MBS2213996.1 hypothetical protein [Carboxylicivirga mesophila]